MKKIKLLFLMCIVLVISGCVKPKSYTRYDDVSWDIVIEESSFYYWVNYINKEEHKEWNVRPYQLSVYTSKRISEYSNCFYVGNDDYLLVIFARDYQ